MKPYGKELILDLHKCDASLFTRKRLGVFFKKLCILLDMKREDLHWWDYQGRKEEYDKAPAHLKGTSAIQFISTSNITIHTLDDLKRIYLNVFSCKEFDDKKAVDFIVRFFKAKHVVQNILIERL